MAAFGLNENDAVKEKNHGGWHFKHYRPPTKQELQEKLLRVSINQSVYNATRKKLYGTVITEIDGKQATPEQRRQQFDDLKKNHHNIFQERLLIAVASQIYNKNHPHRPVSLNNVPDNNPEWDVILDRLLRDRHLLNGLPHEIKQKLGGQESFDVFPHNYQQLLSIARKLNKFPPAILNSVKPLNSNDISHQEALNAYEQFLDKLNPQLTDKPHTGISANGSTTNPSTQTETNTAGKTPVNTIPVESQLTNSQPATPEEIYVSNFIQLLKANAKARLKENSSRLQLEIKKYNKNHPESQKHLQHLRQLIEKDQDLAVKENELEKQVSLKLEELDLQASFFGGLNASPEKQQEQQQQLNLIAQQRQQLKKLPEEIKHIRKVLRAEYPALAVIKSTEISDSTDNDELYLKIAHGFESIQNAIVDVAARLDNNDIPLQKLGPVVNETLLQTNVNPQNRDKDLKSQAILAPSQ